VFTNAEGKSIYAQAMNNQLSKQITRLKDIRLYTSSTVDRYNKSIVHTTEDYVSPYLSELLNSKENIGKPIDQWTSTDYLLLHNPLIQDALSIVNGVVSVIYDKNSPYFGMVTLNPLTHTLENLHLSFSSGIRDTENTERGDAFDTYPISKLHLVNLPHMG